MIAEYNVNLENKTKSELILFIKELQDMLKEKDKEIEKLKQALARNIAKNITSNMKETAKAKEDLEMLNQGWQMELEKKDKIIDLMAEKIDQLGNDYDDFCIDTIWNEDCDEDCKNCIKQYFERKSEE